ncbi:MAG: DUF4338 domain-containing protein [Deltaproteobacteria bacterium]|nr:DUF4338 domain-containing protein [Deltaproteobacteria bacterium]
MTLEALLCIVRIEEVSTEGDSMNWACSDDQTPLIGDLGSFSEPILFHKMDETPEESQWDQLVREYHYLGYVSQIGGRVKYLVSLGARLVGAVSFCSAAYRLGQRDLYVGWDEKTRLEYLPHLLNNNRFLILPWIRVKNLASRVLSMSIKRVREDWERQYDVEPYMVETFVDLELFCGVSYSNDFSRFQKLIYPDNKFLIS